MIQALDQSPASFQPLYQQIKRMLTASLERGEWQPGEAIPAEVELAARYRVSQGTVRKAIDALAAVNLLVRRQGKGTFVATHTEEDSSLFRFLRIRCASGNNDRPASRLLDVRRGKASAEAARLLEVRSGDPIIILRRLLEYAGVPVVLDDISLPAALFKGLNKAKVESYHGSLYSMFEAAYGVRMIRAEERITAVGADAACAEMLRVRANMPLLAVDRVAFTYGDRPVEWRRGLYSTRNHFYYNELA